MLLASWGITILDKGFFKEWVSHGNISLIVDGIQRTAVKIGRGSIQFV